MPQNIFIKAILKVNDARKAMGDERTIRKPSNERTKSRTVTKKHERAIFKDVTRKQFTITHNKKFEKPMENKKRNIGKPNPAIWKKKQAEMMQRKGIALTKSTVDIDNYNPKRDPDPFLWAKVGAGLQVELMGDSDEFSVLTEKTREGEIEKFDSDDDYSVDAERRFNSNEAEKITGSLEINNPAIMEC